MPNHRGGIRQHATHANLIGHGAPDLVKQADPSAPDAIIVPASRTAQNLEQAITLARAVQCQLVILCSRDAHAADVHTVLDARSFSDATVIDMPLTYRHDFFAFATTDWIKEQCPVRDSDLSLKRNVGLVLARMLGWKRIFFLDDDIRDLDAAALLETVALLDKPNSLGQRYCSAGIAASYFPDNSVVCHARRAIGEFQDVFVSGSALAVDCTVPFAFFPDIYNEDWLFFYRDAAEGRLGSSTRRATQLRYDPFANPVRAESEEFGDVIAEALYALLDEDLSVEHATEARWEQFLADRQHILNDIIARSDQAPRHMREKMKHSVEIARKCLKEIQPRMCVQYVQLWRRDLRQWEMTLKEIPRVRSTSDALDRLGLASAVNDAMPRDYAVQSTVAEDGEVSAAAGESCRQPADSDMISEDRVLVTQ